MPIKKILLALILISAVYDKGFSDIFDNLSSLEKDKYVHFSSGVIISHSSYPLFRKVLKNKRAAWIYSLSLATAASIGKEIYDTDRTGFNWGDVFAGTLGGLTIFVVW